MEHKYSINYVYFGILFVLLSLFVASNMSQKNALAGSYFFFFLYALGQVTLEIILFIVVGELIRQFFTKALFFFFIGLTFLALVVHFFDFLIERILDLSVWRALQIFVLDENIENFFYLLDASGISLWIWLLFFVLLSSVPFIGIFFYKMTLLIVQKKPLQLESATLLQAAICLPFALFFWDFSASATIHPDTYTAFTTSLPWKTTFLEPEKRRIHLLNPLANPLDEKGVALAIQEDSTNLRYKPNIYLFIVESLRADAICDEVAPNVQQFKEHSAHFVHAISGANATHISWFSIFHSQFPYHWKHMQERKWSMGSPALNLLKHWGYQVRLYTSAQLGYYKMQDLLFGKDLHLLNAKQEFFHTSTRTAADTDALALAALKKDLLENPELQSGQVFIIFWDCTHFDYSWPKNWTPKFTPYTQKFVYSHALHSKKAIQSMKNKYHNSIHYMDSLFGSFLEFLPDKERAIVAFTGDHGEEFFENGHLFHLSHLTNMQIHVPLFLKFGDLPAQTYFLASQMDIFPSIAHYLSGKHYPFLQGTSIFSVHPWPYAVTARFNAGRTPYEFSIHNGKHKLIAQFIHPNNIFSGKDLKIISLRTSNEKRVDDTESDQWIEKEFGDALKRLFRL